MALPLFIHQERQEDKANERARDAQRQAEEEAQRQEAEARAEQQRLEEKYGLSPGELERQDRMFSLEKDRQGELERRGKLSGEDLLREVGPSTSALLDRVSSRGAKSSEELFAEEGGAPARLLLEELSRPGPTDMFQGELDLVLQEVNKAANRRGVYGGLPQGGIRFENMGRAGVDLAIKSARERLAQRTNIANTLFNIASGARSESGTVAERALGEQTGARNELTQFLNNLENLDSSAQGRAANVATGASADASNTIRQSNQVPLDFAAINAGQAAQDRAQSRETLGELGSLILQGGMAAATGGASAPASFGADILGKSRVEEDPLERLLAFRGGSRY